MSLADRNLLVGVLALQLDFITREQLITAMNQWMLAKSTPLDQILRQQHALADDAQALLTALVAKHLTLHNDDPQQSLAAISSIESIQHALRNLGDADIEATLAAAGRQRHEARRQVGSEETETFHGRRGRRFRVLRPHAKGALGEVFVAQDTELNREVALKEIQKYHADDETSRARFLLEAEITGALEHPGIVPVYGLGQYDDGRPFYAMRLIRGDSLKEAVDRFHGASPASSGRGRDKGAFQGHTASLSSSPLSKSEGKPKDFSGVEFRQLLGRFVDVCNAIEYAHSRGVLHRDLKPGNIMLGRYGETLVVDWGLAKAKGTDERLSIGGEAALRPSSGEGSSHTELGQVIGTPAFMSPEQASGRIDVLGVASDVYSLGATLYYLLTGQPPFAKDGEGNILHRVQRGLFAPPRIIKPEIPKPLDAICLRAMAHEPECRYSSPAALADDIEHYLADEPLAALPDTFSDKFNRFARRHRTLVRTAAAAAFVVAIISSVAAFLVNEQRRVNAKLAREKGELALSEGKLADEKGRLADLERIARTQAERNKSLADERAETLRALLAGSYFEKGLRVYEGGEQDEGLISLIRGLGMTPLDSPAYQGRQSVLIDRCLRGGRLLTPPLRHDDTVRGLAFSPDGSRLATGTTSGVAQLWDAHSGVPIGNPWQHEKGVHSLEFSPDGALVLTGSLDGTARLWSVASGEPVGVSMRHDSEVTIARFSPDGSRILTGTKAGKCQFWNGKSGISEGPTMSHDGAIECLAFSSDGTFVVTGSLDTTARIWNVESGLAVGQPLRHSFTVRSVAVSPDGQLIATAADFAAQTWDARSGEPREGPFSHSASVTGVAFHPDGQSLATSSFDQFARLWSTETGKQFGSPMKHRGYVLGVKYSPDGQQLATSCNDGTVQVWNSSTGDPLGEPLRHHGSVTGFTFSRDGMRVATASADHTVRLWRKEAGYPELRAISTPADILDLALSKDGTQVTAVGRYVTRWDLGTGLRLGEPFNGYRMRSLAMHPNESQFATGAYSGEFGIWDVDSRNLIFKAAAHKEVIYSLAFSPGGRLLASAGDNSVRLWLTTEPSPAALPSLEHGDKVRAVAFSPDGKTIATGSHDDTARLWDAETALPRGEPIRHASDVATVAFSPDGKLLATGCADDTARVWEVATGKSAGEPMRHPQAVTRVAFSPDSKRLATLCTDKHARVWEVSTATMLGQPMSHTESVICAAFTPDGSRLVTGTLGGMLRIWDVSPYRNEELDSMDSSTGLRLWTGAQCDHDGNVRELSHSELKMLREQMAGQDPLSQFQRVHQETLNLTLRLQVIREAMRGRNKFAALYHLQYVPEADRELMQQELERAALLASAHDGRVLENSLAFRSRTRMVSGVLEGESLKVVNPQTALPLIHDMLEFPADCWSGAKQVLLQLKPGQRVELEFSVDKDAEYELGGVFTKASYFAIAQLTLDEKPLGEPIDFYHRANPSTDTKFNPGDVVATDWLPLGKHQLTAGVHRLGVEVIGRNPKADPKDCFGLDYLTVDEVGSNVQRMSLKHPRVTASYTSPYDAEWEANDGIVQFAPHPRNRWTAYFSDSPSDWLQVDFGEEKEFSRVGVAIYDETPGSLSANSKGGGVRTPQSFAIEYLDGETWKPVDEISRLPEQPTGGQWNEVKFEPVKSQKVRAVFKHQAHFRSGVTEIAVWP